jgi:hypothetical protein
MKSFLQKYQYQLYLIAIGLFWILLLNLFLQIVSQNYIYADTKSYIKAAEDLYFQHKPNEIRPLLIAAINGIPFLFGFSKSSLFVWNTILNLTLWLASTLLIYKLCSKILDPKKAFYFALFYVFTLGSLLIAFEFLSEPLFSFSLLVSVLFFQKYDRTKKVKFLSFGISILILSMLIKPASILLTIGTFVLLGHKTLLKVLLDKTSIIIYLSIVLLFTNLQSMKSNYGNYTLSYIDAFTYYNYLGTKADCYKKGTIYNPCNNNRYTYFNKFSLPESKKIAFKDFKYQISKNTFNVIKAYLGNIFANSVGLSSYLRFYENKNNESNFEIYKIFFKGVSRIQCLLYTLSGMVLSIYFLYKKKTDKIIKIVAFSIIYIIAISGISSDHEDRFHLVIYPLILILLANFLSEKGTNLYNKATY